jgi:ribonuclease Z
MKITTLKKNLLEILLLIPSCLFAIQAECKQDIRTNSKRIEDSTIVMRVTLLGTGTPKPIMERFGPSILVQAGSETLLFDAGRGCLQRMTQLNVSYQRISALFLTHLHSDHIVGLPDLWLTGWLTSKRATPLLVFGPVGSGMMIEYLHKAFEYDIKIRIEDDKASPEGSRLSINEIQEGIIYEKNGVKVIAFEVDHFPIKPAFGYRIEYKGHALVLSGDTRYSENLIKYARGTDLLIHEVVIPPDTLSKADPKYNIVAHHTTPQQASKIFNEVKPKLAVYSHISNPYVRNEQEAVRQTKANYPGPIILGEDLMTISVGDSVSVSTWTNK